MKCYLHILVHDESRTFGGIIYTILTTTDCCWLLCLPELMGLMALICDNSTTNSLLEADQSSYHDRFTTKYNARHPADINVTHII